VSRDLSSQSLKLGFLQTSTVRFYQKNFQLNQKQVITLGKKVTHASTPSSFIDLEAKKLLNLWVVLGGSNQVWQHKESNKQLPSEYFNNFYFLYSQLYLMILTAYYKNLIYLIYAQI
jgi:hypothetical protein